jgi:hypothetical protein
MIRQTIFGVDTPYKFNRSQLSIYGFEARLWAYVVSILFAHLMQWAQKTCNTLCVTLGESLPAGTSAGLSDVTFKCDLSSFCCNVWVIEYLL